LTFWILAIVICLLIAIWNFSPKLKHYFFDQTGGGGQRYC
jgi:hypothetical protein